jgi:hypothetical protein
MIQWQDGDWEVYCDPNDGGRIGSIRWRGRELLTQPHLIDGKFEAPADDFGEYENRPVFGYDDCWPCLEVCEWPGMRRKVRDHGDLVWLQWDARVEDGALVASVSDDNGKWRFERRTLARDGALVFEYTCANTGDTPFPMSWAGHVLIPPTPVTGLSLPDFKRARHDSPPDAKEVLRSPRDVWSYLQARPTGASAFLVIEDLSSQDLHLRFDDLDWRWSVEGISNPAIGLWYNRRGYPGSDDLVRDEFGIEWMTCPACALTNAPRATDAVILAPGEERRWRMRWEIAQI